MKRNLLLLLSALFVLLFVVHKTLAGGCASSFASKKKKKHSHSNEHGAVAATQPARNSANSAGVDVASVGTNPADDLDGMPSSSLEVASTQLFSYRNIEERLARLEQMLNLFMSMQRPPPPISNLLDRRIEKRISNLEAQVAEWLSTFDQRQRGEHYWPQIEWAESSDRDELVSSSADHQHSSGPLADRPTALALARKRSLSADDIAKIKELLLKTEHAQHQQQQAPTPFHQRGKASTAPWSSDATEQNRTSTAQVGKGKRPMFEEQTEDQQLPYSKGLQLQYAKASKLSLGKNRNKNGSNGKEPMVHQEIQQQQQPYQGEGGDVKIMAKQLLQYGEGEGHKTVAQLINEAEQRTGPRKGQLKLGHSGELINRYRFQHRRGRSSSRASSTPPSLTRGQTLEEKEAKMP